MKPEKRILVFIDWFLPGYKAGGPITSVRNMIDNLYSEARFMVVTRDRDYMSETPYENIQTDKWIENDRFDVYYVSENQLNKTVIDKIIFETDYDLAMVNGIYSKYFSVIPLKTLKRKNKPIIVSVRGMLAKSARDINPLKKKLFLFYARLSKLFKDVTFHATNKSEASEIKLFFNNNRIVVAPNMLPVIEGEKVKRIQKKQGELKLLFLGRVAPEKNTLFAIQSIKGIKGSVQLDIVGSIYNKEYWQKCEQEISTSGKNIEIKYSGTKAPNEISKLLGAYHFLYLPTRGENFGHAILESLLHDRPVITSEFTPWTDINNKAGFIADIGSIESTEKLIQRIVDINDDNYNELCKSLKLYTQKYVQNNNGLKENRILLGLI